MAVTDDQIVAALDVLRDSDGLPAVPPISWFVRSPTDPPPGPERDAAVAALHRAEEQTEREARDLVRRVLEAALVSSGGLLHAARALAAMDAPEVEHRTDHDASDLRCALCGVIDSEDNDLDAWASHAGTCPWRMARQAVDTEG